MAVTEKPVVYILHGDDENAIQNAIAEMAKKMGDPAMADLNISRLDGRSAGEDEIVTAANAMPFLAERRLVIVQNALARFGRNQADGSDDIDESEKPDSADKKGEKSKAKQQHERFLSRLDQIPETTALVLVIPDQYERKNWKTFKPSHWLFKWVEQAKKRAFTQTFQLPGPREMPQWIIQKARELGGQFSPSAAVALAAHVGNDTRYATNEILKLLNYVDYQRPVEADEVEMLTVSGGPVNIFDMVDSLALGNTTTALRLMHNLLDQQDPLSLFGMIARQFRLLLQTREILDEGGSAQSVQQQLGQHPFVANKLSEQAQRFSMARLEKIYHQLLDLDEGFKTSQGDPDILLDAFIAEIGTR